MVSVIGCGKALRIFLPMTPLAELTAYQTAQNAATLRKSLSSFHVSLPPRPPRPILFRKDSTALSCSTVCILNTRTVSPGIATNTRPSVSKTDAEKWMWKSTAAGLARS